MKQKKPLVSVSIITYNHKNYIREAIESVLRQQTDFDLEICIGNDGSTDGTAQICNEYAKINFPRTIIKVFHREREDLDKKKYVGNGRRNFVKTLKSCEGKYIALLDGDDYWTDPFKLQKQVDLLEQKPKFSGCYHKTQQVNLDGTLGRVLGNSSPKLMRVKDTLAIYSPFHTSSFMFRRMALQFPAWFNRVTSGDMALFSIVSASGPIGRVNDIMSIYRKHGDGITDTDAVKLNYHQKRIELMQHLNAFHQFSYAKKIKTVIEWHENAIKGNVNVPTNRKSLREYLNNIIRKLM